MSSRRANKRVGTALLVGTAGNDRILDEETSNQINELATLRDEHETRLRHLLRQQANLGRSTPVEINIEIEAIQVKVGRITGDIGRLQIGASQRSQLATRAGAVNNLTDISTQIGDTSTAILHGIHTLIALLLQAQDSDAPQRKKRQRLTLAFYVVISLLVAADVLARIFIH